MLPLGRSVVLIRRQRQALPTLFRIFLGRTRINPRPFLVAGSSRGGPLMAHSRLLQGFVGLVLIAGSIACAPGAPVAPSPAMNSGGNLSSSIVPPGDPLTPLGGLDLDDYCRSLGYVNSTLTKPQIGPNAAFNNWRCQASDGGTHPFSMTQACQWQYGTNAVQAHPSDTDDAYTWVCYLAPGGQE